MFKCNRNNCILYSFYISSNHYTVLIQKSLSIFVFLLFFFCGNAVADSKNRNTKLNQLFRQLKNSATASTALKIEIKIWDIWITHPTEKKLTRLLAKGSNLMDQRKLEESYKIFSKVIQTAPDWAEAWNKRATVLYLMGRYQESFNDIDRVLKLEKRHFGALSGQGLVLLKLENYAEALESYKRAQKIYPLINAARVMIPRLEKLIANEYI